jgi:hypothetical protein
VHTVHRHGAVTYAPQMVGAALIHPDGRAVIPLMPEPIGQDDGTDNNDCERHAATRLVVTLRQDHPRRQCIVTEDRLSSNAPHIETLHQHDRHDILGVTEGDHAFVFQPIQTAEPAGRVTVDERPDRAVGVRHRFRCVNDVPLKASNVNVRVHFIAYWEIGATTVHHCSWVTDLRVSTRHVLHRMRGGRARWKIEHAPFTTLNNQGDHVEHNYGHGAPHLAVVFAMLMRLACLVDQTQHLCCALLQAVWAKLGSKRLLWERLRALFDADALTSMRQLFEALVYGVQNSRPLVTIDSTSCPIHRWGHRVSGLRPCHHSAGERRPANDFTPSGMPYLTRDDGGQT